MDKAQFLTLMLAMLSLICAVGGVENAVREKPPLNLDTILAFLLACAVIYRMMTIHN